jgi:inorganic pyrophosphatase/exopolyphosphatase
MFYEFCGEFDDLLKKDYRKFKLKDQGVTYPQYCVTVFATFIEEANDVLNIKKKKR